MCQWTAGNCTLTPCRWVPTELYTELRMDLPYIFSLFNRLTPLACVKALFALDLDDLLVKKSSHEEASRFQIISS